MAGNFYLPQKADSIAQYSLPSPGTYTWTAPDANNDLSPYALTVDLWGAGGGGSSGAYKYSGGGGGGGGAYRRAEVTITPGNLYTFYVGAGGVGGATVTSEGPPSNAGSAGGKTAIEYGAFYLRADGGSGASGGSETTIKTGGAGGLVTDSAGAGLAISPLGYRDGGVGGNGGRAISPVASPANGSSVTAVINEPGGAGGTKGTGVGSGVYTAGGGGGASSHTDGGNGGSNRYSDYNTAGGGGGTGYQAGTAGSNAIGVTWYGGAGGAGGDGYLTFNFAVTNGGTAGSAPA